MTGTSAASGPSIARITAVIENSEGRAVTVTCLEPLDASIEFSRGLPSVGLGLLADAGLLVDTALSRIDRRLTITMKPGLGHPVETTWTGPDDAAAAKLARLEAWLHERQLHPDFEYETTTGPRKAWDRVDAPPAGDGWVRNTARGAPDGWERFDYHEESYWMRPKAAGADSGEPRSSA